MSYEFEREYFEEKPYTLYRDFATHYSTSRIIMENKPQSLLDVGGARGYVVRILENQGVRAVCMDISNHCWHSRATDSFVIHDARKVPWPFVDKEFDIGFSINFLEHIEEEKLDSVIKEFVRVSRRGIHGIHFSESPFKEEFEDIDKSHVCMHTAEWWKNKFNEAAPDYPVRIGHPRILEYEEPEHNPPISHMPPPTDDLVKLNLGSFLDMFYDNWINIDIVPLIEFAESQKYTFRHLDVTKGLPWGDNSVDYIISNHLIEHISREEGHNLLKECYRVMKPDSILRISTPDTKLITDKYIKGEILEYKIMNVGVENAKDDAEAYYNLLLAGHKTIYDEKALKGILEDVGFQVLPPVTCFTSNNDIFTKQTITTHPSVSLVMEANN